MSHLPPHIAMDGRMLGGIATGVGTYADTLRRTLDLLGMPPLIVGEASGRRELRPIRWWRALGRRPRRLEHDAGEPLLTGRTGLFREAQIHFDIHRRPMMLETDTAPGIMHWTYPVPIHLKGWINLYTVHDAIPLIAPSLTSINPRRHRAMLDALLAKQGRFLTVSAASRDDIAMALKMRPGDIFTVWQGVDCRTAPAKTIDRPRDYFLFYGSLERRKNIAALVNAHRLSGVSMPLVLAGNAAAPDPAIDAALAANPAAQLIGPQPRDALNRLIAGARAVLFVSQSEGFGLPIVEAMILNTPVLTANHGAQAEIAGGAAMTVDCGDVAAIAAAIHQLATDDTLCAGLREAGRTQSAQFSLARYGARLRNVYEQLWAGPAGATA